MNVTLFKPGIDPTKGAVNITSAGGGVVLESLGAGHAKPHYFDTEQEAREFIVKSVFALLHAGYRIYTGDGITE